MNKEINENFDAKQQKVLGSIRISRIILPILIGIGAVIYILMRQFNPEEFAAINWDAHTIGWIIASFIFLVIRHLAYALRLRILSDQAFSWRKCIELVFIWEFSSAVSPTSVGGSAVALFVLAQEKLSTAKTATIVIYSAILDTIFFVFTLPILLIFFGPQMIRPEITNFNLFDGWGYAFMFAYVLMLCYGSLFFYGLFINPSPMKRFLVILTSIWGLRRFRGKAIELGNDLIIASKEMKFRKWSYHLTAFLATATAWSCRFLLINCLIIAFVDTTPMDFFSQANLYARLETMFVVLAFSPTPGGAGFAELTFFGFTSDYISTKSVALTIAFIWRILTYYSYLLLGVIIIPNWIRKIINERKKKRLLKKQQASQI